MNRAGVSGARGFTLIEFLVGAFILVVAIVAILGAFFEQQIVNEHASNLSLAIQDANRVIEQIRQNNASCAIPSALPPVGFGSWDAWLGDTGPTGGGGKSLRSNELVLLMCQDRTGTRACVPGDNPLRLTVAVCWRHRNRTIGECAWDGAALVPEDGQSPFTANGVIESPAMLTTLVTCRG